MLVHRQAVRALILSPDHEVLLCRIHTPSGGPSFWIAPGGGLEPGETADEGLRRELAEELGLTDFEAGPVVWRRHHTFDWGDRRISQHEEYRVVHIDRFEPVMSDPVEAEVLECFRWANRRPRLSRRAVHASVARGHPAPLSARRRAGDAAGGRGPRRLTPSP